MDSSTVGPDTPRELAPEAQAKGLTFVDAPVTGAVPAARAGTLTFLVGGTEAEYNAVKPILLGMGKNIVHCGATGTGQVAKICNNMCLAINMISTAETLMLAKRLGLSPKLMNDILNIISGRSWCSEIYCPLQVSLKTYRPITTMTEDSWSSLLPRTWVWLNTRPLKLSIFYLLGLKHIKST